METRDVVLHTGYPKAASTWLQKRVFLEAFGFQHPWPTHENAAIEYFVMQDKSRFDAKSIRDAFFNACKPGAGAPIISHEALVGDPIAGRYAGFETAERLAATFPGARVIVFFRAQESYAYSAWVEHLRRGGRTSIERYIGPDDGSPEHRPFCPLEFLNFDLLISHYAQLFGRDRVLALPMEAIPNGEALNHLASFLKNDRIRNCDVGPVYTGLQGASVRLVRLLNGFLSNDPARRDHRAFFMRQILRADRRLPRSVHAACRRRDGNIFAARLGGRFAESNRRLQQLTPIDLSKFDYEL